MLRDFKSRISEIKKNTFGVYCIYCIFIKDVGKWSQED